MARALDPVTSVRAVGAARPSGAPLMRGLAAGGLAWRLRELGGLAERGLLTPEEFTAAKARLLGR
ncbi:SHOCT domain-containing protein [Kitasatospora sp. NPDC056138]|uniref:SHOCT domain-containing protein n=1 Tax=Kitasatospora sp. NPDC056138 TaxID=3345724 RepID=UPI0035D78557